jgi:hypothetical protein
MLFATNKIAMHKKITSLKFIGFFSVLIFSNHFGNAQNGLENIIVEKYYISDAADSAGSIGYGDTLRVGSVTYRIYADMLPGYKFQALYGVNTPGAEHELRLSTTTFFFNNTDRGTTNPNGISVTNTKKNTVMIDSWFSTGAMAAGKVGVLKSDDSDGSIGNTDGILQNIDASAGIPVKTQDGMAAGTPEAVTFVGLTTELDVFDATPGNLFSTWNGSIASLNGSAGPTSDNRVLIGQFTTDGVFCFWLNIQIGTPSGGTENYVAQSPVGSEIQLGSLIYCSDVGIKEQSVASASMKVYPNPANNNFKLEFTPAKKSNSNSYSIYSIYGSLIFHKELGTLSEKYSEMIDISSLSDGMYIIELMTDGVTSAKQFIKQ